MAALQGSDSTDCRTVILHGKWEKHWSHESCSSEGLARDANGPEAVSITELLQLQGAAAEKQCSWKQQQSAADGLSVMIWRERNTVYGELQFKQPVSCE